MPKIEVANNLSFDWQSALLIIISTILIVAFSKKYFWKNVMDYLNKRHLYIQEQLNSAELKNKEASQLKEDYHKQLDDVRTKSKQLMEEAVISVSKEKEVMLDNAKKDAQNIVEKAKQDMEYEKRKTKEEMNSKIKSLAFVTAGQILNKEINEQTHNQFVDSFIEELNNEDTSNL